MGVLVAPMMGIVQWSDVLVCKNATNTIWSGPMDEMHFAGMAAFTTELRLIGKVEKKHHVFMVVSGALWLICELLEGADDVFLMAS
jgi:hypothetical protein